jgi:hypothetical protein
MNVLYLRDQLTYDGSQLASHWAYDRLGVQGDAIVYFVGPCEVQPQALVDLADRRQGDFIRAEEMLHFIVEHFGADLHRTVLRQRLLVCIAADVLREQAGGNVLRRGDDLFIGDRKLSVSIATVSPVSGLIHLGLNVSPAGAPVAAVGLNELGVEAAPLGEEIARRYADEMGQVTLACTKVRWVT